MPSIKAPEYDQIVGGDEADRRAVAADERREAAGDDRHRRRRHPISRWYLCPLAEVLAVMLSPTPLRPAHLTLLGLAAAAGAAAMLIFGTGTGILAAVLVMAAWFFDRLDGALARRQRTATAWGAWLDANVDELVDVGLHVATAYVAAYHFGSRFAWLMLVGFLGGKYLFMVSVAIERQTAGRVGDAKDEFAQQASSSLTVTWLRRAYHFLANTDVRVHLLAAAVLTGLLTLELGILAVYYNVRWVVRYGVVARRLVTEAA